MNERPGLIGSLGERWFRALRQSFALQGDPGSSGGTASLLRRGDIHIDGAERLTVGEGTRVGTAVNLVAGSPDNTFGEGGSIELGDGVYIGNRVQLAANPGMRLRIKDHTSIQDNSILLGDICVERYCLFAYNIYVSSGQHLFDVEPTWLIRDQDRLKQQPEAASRRSQAVHIEEDCWIGFGVFVMPGIYIGRGAVIGANCVVTKDVPPYSVQAGVPNRELRKRFEFDPPAALDAMQAAHWPYFYSGFLVRQEEVAESRASGVLRATSRVRLMVRGGAIHRLELKGLLADGVSRVALALCLNGIEVGEVVLDRREFHATVEIPPNLRPASGETCSRSGVLSPYNELWLTVQTVEATDSNAAAKEKSLYGLSAFSVS